MTYREKYFLLQKISNPYINNSVIKALLQDDGGFNDFTSLIKNFDKELKNEKELDNKIEKVKNGEPLQYVLGYAYFVNSNYKVTPDVLIPRQETEQLAVTTLSMIVRHFGKDPDITIVDVGTGSGILANYLKEYFPHAKVIATDISQKALEIAKENARIHKNSIDFRHGNMLDPVKEKIDVIVSNPPYIGSPESVSEQTLKYEPHIALFASPKTKYYEEILSHLDQMNETCLFAFEIGEDMENELADLLEVKYQGLAYKFEEDIYHKTRFLYILRKKDLVSYEF